MALQELLQDILDGSNQALNLFLSNGGDPNTLDPRWNCTIVFHAIFSGNFDSVKLLVDAGADVNRQAMDPGADILAITPLALAMQCRLMMDNDKYSPIVSYLEENGAEQEPQMESNDQTDQSNKEPK